MHIISQEYIYRHTHTNTFCKALTKEIINNIYKRFQKGIRAMATENTNKNMKHRQYKHT